MSGIVDDLSQRITEDGKGFVERDSVPYERCGEPSADPTRIQAPLA
jgi:hypothetical protein